MRTLYAEIEPQRRYRHKVDGIHEIYFEESGNLSGIPVLFLHGGPGAGSNENHRRYFDPDRYRIVNFDQRGCNRSSPAGETRQNTTADLIADIELIRDVLGISRWLIFGGSWGAALGLLYAQEHPERITGMILRGTFLARKRDLDWFINDGANRLLPEAWEVFKAGVPEEQQSDLVAAYYHAVQSDAPDIVENAARHWAAWSGRVVTWQMGVNGSGAGTDIGKMINEVRIETHYARHNYFIEENSIINNAGKIPAVPVTIIHGRRDLTCTLDSSWALHTSLPGSEFIVVNEGGHLAGEPVMTDALIRATDTMAGVVS